MPWSKRRKRFNRTFDVGRHKRYLFMRSVQGWLSQNISTVLDHAILYGINPPADAPKPECPPVPDIILRLSGITREEWDRKKDEYL